MYDLKWCNLLLRCFVLGLNLCTFAISRAPVLSSKTLQCTFASAKSIGIPIAIISSNSLIIGIASLKAYDKPVYSDSVDDNATSVCSCDFHTNGHPANVMKYPCLDLAVSRS